jgi:hypothetical protein
MKSLSRCRSWIAAASLVLAFAGSSFAAEKSAEELMSIAHDGRAVWHNFHGFSADIVATADGKSTKGTLEVSPEGALTLKLDDPSQHDWVDRTLQSVVSHRLSDDGAITNVEFADEDANHPLGRLLKSKDAAEKSLWRVKGDVLTEVHRNHGKSRFIISVSEVSRTLEGKHLPHSFVVTTWSNETNAIEKSRQVYNEWKRFGHLDLPTRLVAMNAKNDGTRTVEEIVLAGHVVKAPKVGSVSIQELAPLKSPVTSFGAAIADGHLYTYGGHLGSPHSYSAEEQTGELLRLSVAKPESWEALGNGPKRTGLAMVAYGGKLYRVGGWESQNKAGEKWNLFSQSDFARFDPKTGKWEDLTPLPQGRSSHDAAVLGSKLYVVGGWKLDGEGDGEWHDTALVADLAADKPEWKEIASPPFMRRALAVAAFNGKVYVIGGMTDSNEATTAVSIYDEQSNSWSEGPAIPGKGFDGFGTSAIATKEGIYCTAGSGGLFRLSNDGKQWEEVGQLSKPRMFHRLVATDDGRLLVVGGTSRKTGKVTEVEAIEVKLASAAK